MGLLDKLKGSKSKASKKVAEHEEQIDSSIDKAADFADDKTGAKHSDKIDTAADKAKDAVDKIADSDD
jgi:ABC-type transporter Mla subunit MlaD